MRATAVFLFASLILQADPQPIQRMAATDRAYAAAAAEIGVRDATLAFLAADAVAILPGTGGEGVTGVERRPRIAAEPLAKLPLGLREMSAPVTGHISADGTLGWTTGARAALNLPTRSLANQGAYFRVWTITGDGAWRLWFEDAVRFPDIWHPGTDAFLAAPDPDEEGAGEPADTVDRVESAVAGGGEAWQARWAPAIRVHRAGRMPLAGRAEAVEWAASTWTAVTFTTVITRVAQSDDLAVALGGYDATGANGREHGRYARAWKRDLTGRWHIVFEMSRRH